MKRYIQLQDIGTELLGVSMDGVSFIIWKKDYKQFLENLNNLKNFTITSITGKKLTFTVSEQLNSYIVSDPQTEGSVLIDIPEEKRKK